LVKEKKDVLGLDNYGQAEAVFRLMVDSIVGLVILLIIVGCINYFNGQEIESSRIDLITTIQSAVSSPNGQVIVSQRDLSFAGGSSISASNAQTWTQLNEKCFSFDSKVSEGSIKLKGESERNTLIEFSQRISLKVYVQCKSNIDCEPLDPNSCCMVCEISFGKKIE